MKKIVLLALYYSGVLLSMTFMEFSVFVFMMSLFFELVAMVLLWAVYQCLEERRLRLSRFDLLINIIPVGLLCYSAAWLASNELGEFVDLSDVRGTEPLTVFWPQLLITFVLSLLIYGVHAFWDYNSQGKFYQDTKQFVFLTLLVVLLCFGIFGVFSIASTELRPVILITVVFVRLFSEYFIRRYLRKF